MDLHSDTDSVREYCRNHELSRPPINWFLIALVVFVFETALFYGLSKLPLSASSFFFCLEGTHILVFALFGGAILRLIVRIYQRYAPESLRRQCSCQPTCSEYALLALKKYCWPKALMLIIKRVTHTCQQPGYKIDYP